MALAVVLKALVALLGAGLLLRGARRRLRPRPGDPPLDPALSRGLRVAAWAGAVASASIWLLPLSLTFGWPRWVGRVGDAVFWGAAAVLLPLALWLGWRLLGEEAGLGAAPGEPPGADRDRVT